MDSYVTIRAAKVEDAAAISQLLCDLSRCYLLDDFTEQGAKRLLRAMSEKAIRSYIREGFCYHLAEQKQAGKVELLGVVATRDNSHLYHLFVAELAQGKGLASRLWKHAKALCIANGNKGEFTVNASLSAKAMYQAWGFVAEQEQRDTKGIIDVPMRLTLNEQTKEKTCN